jgi:hypothetical protein
MPSSNDAYTHIFNYFPIAFVGEVQIISDRWFIFKPQLIYMAYLDF